MLAMVPSQVSPWFVSSLPGPATEDGLTRTGSSTAATSRSPPIYASKKRGLHLLERELEALRRRKAPARLLVTTTFQTTSPSAAAMARGLGLYVRVLNPGSGRTFHPKLYLGTGARVADAV